MGKKKRRHFITPPVKLWQSATGTNLWEFLRWHSVVSFTPRWEERTVCRSQQRHGFLMSHLLWCLTRVYPRVQSPGALSQTLLLTLGHPAGTSTLSSFYFPLTTIHPSPCPAVFLPSTASYQAFPCYVINSLLLLWPLHRSLFHIPTPSFHLSAYFKTFLSICPFSHPLFASFHLATPFYKLYTFLIFFPSQFTTFSTQPFLSYPISLPSIKPMLGSSRAKNEIR